jgi:hypothetical protein
MGHAAADDWKSPRSGAAVTLQQDDHAIACLTSLAVLTLALLALLALLATLA